MLLRNLIVRTLLTTLIIPSVALLLGSQPAQSYDADQTLSGTRQVGDTKFVLPTVTLNGEPVSEVLVTASLKFRYMQSSIFHADQDFAAFAREKMDQTLDTLIPRLLLGREGLKLGIPFDEERFEAFFSQRIEDFGGRKSLERMFTSVGLSMDEYRNLARHSFEARLYVENLYENVDVSEEETRDYYLANREKYGRLEVRTVSLTRFIYNEDPAPSAAVGELKSSVGEIRSIEGLQQFTRDHRKKFSVKTNTMEKIVFTEKKGGLVWPGVSTLLEERSGYYFTVYQNRKEHYLLLVEKIQPEDIKPYEDVRTRVFEKIRVDRRNELLREKVRQLTDAADVSIVYPP